MPLEPPALAVPLSLEHRYGRRFGKISTSASVFHGRTQEARVVPAPARPLAARCGPIDVRFWEILSQQRTVAARAVSE
jgi:hypothetical protein